MRKRFWEIDFFRGAAVILMIFFNYSFALNFFGIFSLFRESFIFWFAFPRFIGAMFIFIMGVSLVISHAHAKKRGINLLRKYVMRGLKIIMLGVVITGATYLFFPRLTVFFGILHLIGLSIILSFPFVGRKKTSLILGIGFSVIGLFATAITVDFPWLIWLGIAPVNFLTFDYFPILPWFGVALLGIFAGNILYGKGKQKFVIADKSKYPIFVQCAFLGRHPLIIYFLHIPALIAILYALGFGVL